MKDNNVYNLSDTQNNEKEFSITISDTKALNIIEEIPEVKRNNFLAQ